MRVRDVKGRSQIAGYEKNWFLAESVDYGLQNKRPTSTKHDDVGRGMAQLQSLTIKKNVDRATCDLMFQGMKGETIPSVEIQIVENAKNGDINYPFLMLRFEEVFLEDWKLSLEVKGLSETVVFDYLKVAIEYHRTTDGITYERVGNKGWDSSLKGSNDQMGAAWDYSFKQRGDH